MARGRLSSCAPSQAAARRRVRPSGRTAGHAVAEAIAELADLSLFAVTPKSGHLHGGRRHIRGQRLVRLFKEPGLNRGDGDHSLREIREAISSNVIAEACRPGSKLLGRVVVTGVRMRFRRFPLSHGSQCVGINVFVAESWYDLAQNSAHVTDVRTLGQRPARRDTRSA